jgi:hypothetical protein
MRHLRAIETLPSNPDRVAVIGLDRHDPLVLHLLNEYRRATGQTPGGVSDDGSQWHGLLVGDEITVVFADRRYDGCIYVDNLCPIAGRKGVQGVYTVLRLYRAAVDMGAVRKVAGTVLLTNERALRAMRKVFGVPSVPVAQVFVYSGGGN